MDVDLLCVQLLNSVTEEEFHDLLGREEYDFRYDCGISQPASKIKYCDRAEVISTFSLHYCIIRVKAELDQIIAGLEMFGIRKLSKENPQLSRSLFVHFKPVPLTADKLFDLFPARFSPQGSNRREEEEAALMRWINFTQEIEGS